MAERHGPGSQDIPQKDPSQDQRRADATPKVDRKEGEARYEKLVLGHPLHEIDIDQIVSMKVAQVLGLVPEGVPVECVPHVDETALENPKVLAVEGFDSTRPGTNTLETGNFHNGPHDLPAAYMMLTSVMKRIPDKDDPKYADDGKGKFNRKLYSDDFNSLLNAELGKHIKSPYTKADRQKLQHLVWHLARNESSKKSLYQPAPDESIPPNEFDDTISPDVLNHDDLKQIATITAALRDRILMDKEGNKEERIFAAINTAMDHLFDTSRTQLLSELYSEQIEAVEKQKRQVREQLTGHFITEDADGNTQLNRKHLRMVRLSNGLRVTYADISGTDVRYGGPRIAMNLVKNHTRSLESPNGEETDILVFVNDEFGADGKKNDRKKVLIKVPIERSGKVDLDMQELAERLNASEELFGGGKPVVSLSRYGGHTELVASPQFVGTGLEPENVFTGLQSYLDVPRYTEAQFQKKAEAIARKLKIETYTIDRGKPSNKYEIAQRHIILTIPGREPIAISEEDIPIYEEVLTADVNSNMALLSENTPASEPKAIVARKIERAKVDLERYIEDVNAPRILEALQYLPTEYISSLDGETLLAIFESIADDPVAISQVYNKLDTRFGIMGENTAEWMITKPERYREMLYEYRSTVQSKVDWTINHVIQRYVTASRNVKLQERYAFTLEKILLSKPYRESHSDVLYAEGGKTYDNHLASMMRLVANTDIDRLIRKTIARVLGVNYGPEMKAHWEDLATEDKTAFIDAIDAFPDEFTEIVDVIELDPSIKSIEGVRGSRVFEPTAEGIAASIREQRERGVARPAISILVQISGRDTESALQEKGILLDNVTGKREKTEFTAPDAKIRVTRWLKQEGIDRSYEDSEDPKVADEIVRLIQMIDVLDPETEPEKKAMIRVIKDGFSGPLEEDYGRKISTPHPRSKRKELIGFDIQNRLFHCSYMQGEGVYCDRKYLREDE